MIVVRPNQDSPPSRPSSGCSPSSRSMRGIASTVRSHWRIFHQRFTRIPIMNTTTGSEEALVVSRSFWDFIGSPSVCEHCSLGEQEKRPLGQGAEEAGDGVSIHFCERVV